MRKILLASAVLMLSSGVSNAAILLTENFNYSDGAINTVSGGLWVSHGGGTTPLNVVSGKALINQGDTTGGRDDYNRALSSTFDPSSDNTSVIYSGFIANWSVLPSLGTQDGSYFAHFKSSAASEFYGRINATLAGAASGFFRVGITTETTSAANTQEVPLDLSLNTDYLIVTKLDLSTDRVTLWINPTSEASSNVVSIDAPTYAAGSINAYALRQGTSGTGGYPGVLTVDGLKVATTFAEVVPEPASLGLLAGAGVLALRRRRMA